MQKRRKALKRQHTAKAKAKKAGDPTPVQRKPRHRKRPSSPQAAGGSMPTPARKSQHKGVSWAKVRRKWQVQIRINGKVRHFGYFADEAEAAAAYAKAAESKAQEQMEVEYLALGLI